MADGLNGGGSARHALRLAFAPGTQREAAPAVAAVGAAGEVEIGGVTQTAALVPGSAPRARLDTGSSSHNVLIERIPDPRRTAMGIERLEIVVDGWRFEIDVESAARAGLRDRATSGRGDATRGGPAELRAIIPGRVVSVDVAAGDAVEAGARLLVIEAMKMQNELRAPRAGSVASVEVGPGQTVELGDVLLVIE